MTGYQSTPFLINEMLVEARGLSQLKVAEQLP